MSASLPVSARFRRDMWPLVIPAAVAFAYVCLHLTWYRDTPLGQVPVLDEQENLALAEAIVHGALPAEPFYRAPGYALLLAGMRAAGVPAEGLFQAALIFGCFLHAANAALVAAIARTFFGGGRAALLSGLLYALNPTFVHYSTQALDAVPSLTLFLMGLCWLAPNLTPLDVSRRVSWRWAGASVSWAAAAMIRPNYLFLWLTLPMLAFWFAAERSPRLLGVAATLAGVAVFAAVAGWQWRVSGVAGFLPWQGAYNLWAANRPGAHGRYYVQQHAFTAAAARQNPARAESIYLYQGETGAPAADIGALNAHWRERFTQQLGQHPIAWMGLMARKTYALLNNWEQYNNKTFAFHRARAPWLRWNPLGWGVVFVLGIAGAARLAHVAPGTARSLTVVTAAGAGRF